MTIRSVHFETKISLPMYIFGHLSFFFFNSMYANSPHNCILPDSLYRWLHSGKDWESTRPLVPGSSSQCSQLGICSSGCFLHPDTGRSFCTDVPPQPLKSYGGGK